VSSFSAVPPLIRTGDPDFALIRTKVAEAVGKSEALDKGAPGGDGKTSSTPRSTTSKPTSGSTKKTPKPSSSPSKPTNDVDDVASICKA
jgi:hypothetical protein